jgi:hypothetical protein
VEQVSKSVAKDEEITPDEYEENKICRRRVIRRGGAGKRVVFIRYYKCRHHLKAEDMTSAEKISLLEPISEINEKEVEISK